MSRDYQRTRRNQWVLPHNLYRQTLYAIRDYPRLKEEYEYLLQGQSAEIDDQPKGNHISDPTAATVIKAERLRNRIKAIEDARVVVPVDYIKGVWDNILYGKPFPEYAHRNTYGYHKAHFVYEVAKNLTLVE